MLKKQQQNRETLKMTRFSRSCCLFLPPWLIQSVLYSVALRPPSKPALNVTKQCSLTTAQQIHTGVGFVGAEAAGV